MSEIFLLLVKSLLRLIEHKLALSLSLSLFNAMSNHIMIFQHSSGDKYIKLSYDNMTVLTLSHILIYYILKVGHLY